jgi:hypothetical protein
MSERVQIALREIISIPIFALLSDFNGAAKYLARKLDDMIRQKAKAAKRRLLKHPNAATFCQRE